MSPAGLVVNYNLREADAHRSFSHLVSKADPLGLPHSRAHAKRVPKPESRSSRGAPSRSGYYRNRDPASPRTDWLSAGSLRSASDWPEAAIAPCSPLALSLQPEPFWGLPI